MGFVNDIGRMKRSTIHDSHSFLNDSGGMKRNTIHASQSYVCFWVFPGPSAPPFGIDFGLFGLG